MFAAMEGAAPYIMIAALLAVLAALFAGLVVMARGGQASGKWSNKLMQWRVALQALALVIFVILVAVLS